MELPDVSISDLAPSTLLLAFAAVVCAISVLLGRGKTANRPDFPNHGSADSAQFTDKYYPNLSGKSDSHPLKNWGTESLIRHILKHTSNAREQGLHSAAWNWEEIEADELCSMCTSSPFSLKLVGEYILERIGLLCTEIDVEFVQFSPDNAPAYVELCDSWNGVTAFISIRQELSEDDTALATVLAHELCHAFLLVTDHPMRNSERVTDLCAIALGLGPVLYEGRTKANLGYLSPDEIRRGIAISRRLRGAA